MRIVLPALVAFCLLSQRGVGEAAGPGDRLIRPQLQPVISAHGGFGPQFRTPPLVVATGARFGARLRPSPRVQLGLVAAMDLDFLQYSGGWANEHGDSGNGPLVGVSPGVGFSLTSQTRASSPMFAAAVLWEAWHAGYPPPFGVGPEALFHTLALDLAVLFAHEGAAHIGVGFHGKVAGPSLVPPAHPVGRAYTGLLHLVVEFSGGWAPSLAPEQ